MIEFILFVPLVIISFILGYMYGVNIGRREITEMFNRIGLDYPDIRKRFRKLMEDAADICKKEVEKGSK